MPIKRDDNILKIYACIKATKISSKYINKANPIETGTTKYVFRIKINPSKANITI